MEKVKPWEKLKRDCFADIYILPDPLTGKAWVWEKGGPWKLEAVREDEEVDEEEEGIIE